MNTRDFDIAKDVLPEEVLELEKGAGEPISYQEFLEHTLFATMSFNCIILEQRCKYRVFDRNDAFSKDALYAHIDKVDVLKGKCGMLKTGIKEFNINPDLPPEAQPRDVRLFFHAQ